MRVYLIGFMGSGKTTFGKKIAAKMTFDFYDLDKQFEVEEGASVAEIFAAKGETYFREREMQLLHETASLDNVIISCGGGTPCFFDNMEWMRKHGTTVYLKVPEEFLFQRLKTRKSGRPLIAHMKDAELQSYIHNKLAEREQYYLQAQQIIDPTSVKPRFVAELLMQKKR